MVTLGRDPLPVTIQVSREKELFENLGLLLGDGVEVVSNLVIIQEGRLFIVTVQASWDTEHFEPIDTQ